ncbi:alpha/beta hydrolase [Streptomyces sp. NPDC046939]|uniref:alpha/beta hydrolase n=1 Tax=Streptomyces sp. NPDC046939 TaxID=3155376 RepID=UPI003410A4AF
MSERATIATEEQAERPVAPDWLTVTDAELFAYREAENRFRASEAARAVTGQPDVGASITWETVALPGRDLPVRVHRPLAAPEGSGLPLVVHVHGGGFVGTAVQSDWVTSHVAARLPAVVVSVEHRLLAPDSPLVNAVDDGWDVLQHVARQAGEWGVDPARVAVFGESCGALITALTALRARETGPRLRAQVLVNPAVDVTDTMLDYPSVAEHGDGPSLATAQLRLTRRLGLPDGTDPRPLSPLYADDLGGLAPALLIVPTHDAVADHGRRYAEALRAAGTPTRLTEYPGAVHAFLSLPGLVPQAGDARTEILDFLRDTLAPAATE